MGLPIVPIIAGGAALYNAIQGGRQQGQANDLEQEALDLARRDYNSREPLRRGFLTNATKPIAAAPDLSGVFADPSNPFYTGGALPQVGSQLDFSGLDVTTGNQQLPRGEPQPTRIRPTQPGGGPLVTGREQLVGTGSNPHVAPSEIPPDDIPNIGDIGAAPPTMPTGPRIEPQPVGQATQPALSAIELQRLLGISGPTPLSGPPRIGGRIV